MKCAICGGGTRAVKVKHAIKVGERTMSASLPAMKCRHCGDVSIAGRDLERFEHAAARAIISAGFVNGESFRFLRKVLGLTAKDLAPMLGSTNETICRWEKGVRPVDRTAWLTLAMLVADGGAAARRIRPADVIDSALHPKSLPPTVQP